jgi:hypothetical protein
LGIDALPGPAHEFASARLQRQLRGIFGPACARSRQRRHDFIDHLLHQRLAAAELVLHRPQRDFGATRNFLQIGLLKPNLL